MSERQAHPSHVFPDHGSHVFREVRGAPSGVVVRSEPHDLDARIEADRTAVWIRHDRPSAGRVMTLRGGEWVEIPGSERIVEFEAVKGPVSPERVEQSTHECWVCGHGIDYRRLKQ